MYVLKNTSKNLAESINFTAVSFGLLLGIEIKFYHFRIQVVKWQCNLVCTITKRYIIIEEGSNYIILRWHILQPYAYKLFCFFQSPNSRSEPFNMISILKCAWRPNFTFFGIFLLFINHFENHWSNGGLTQQWNRWISDFQSGLINSKKIPKKCKIWSPSTF